MNIAQRIADRSALIGIIGLGYVGLPLARAFADAGLRILGFDIDPAKIEQLAAGHNYLKHLGPDFVKAMLKPASPAPSGGGGPSPRGPEGASAAPLFSATSDFSRLAEPDAIIICVPTPLGQHLEPDLSFVAKTADAIAKTLRSGQLIVLESTSYPGTTREIVLPPLERTGLKCGSDTGFFLAFSPEREDPGRKDHSTTTIPKLVGGIDAPSGELAAALYRRAIKQVVLVSSAEVAEAAKILENTYRAINIALVNELKVLFTAMNIDIWEVIAAASTKPFGFHPFYPGPGLGGHCIPIDPFYLTWKAREVGGGGGGGHTTRFIELAGQINHSMPDYVVSRLTGALNDRSRSVRGSRILILGLAYKPDIDDVRESPSLELIEKLKDLGAEVDYNDPHVPATHQMRRYNLNMKSIPLSPKMLATYDAVLISTHHSAYDWQLIADHAKLIIDTRNAMKNVKGRREHIVSA